MSGQRGRSGGDRTSYGDSYPPGFPKKPTDLGKDEGAIWDHLLEKIPAEILRPIDQHQLAVLVSLLSRERKLAKVCRQDPTDFAAGRAYVSIIASIGKLSVLFGLSPLDRTRIRYNSAGPVDDADDWLQGG